MGFTDEGVVEISYPLMEPWTLSTVYKTWKSYEELQDFQKVHTATCNILMDTQSLSVSSCPDSVLLHAFRNSGESAEQGN